MNKTILKLTLLILSITLVNCKKSNDDYVVELKNQPAIVRLMTDLPDVYELDELFYLELVNPNPKLTYTTLYVTDMNEVYNSDEFFDQFKTEGLAVKVSGSIFIADPKSPAIPLYVKFNGISFHHIALKSIETTE